MPGVTHISVVAVALMKSNVLSFVHVSGQYFVDHELRVVSSFDWSQNSVTQIFTYATEKTKGKQHQLFVI